MIVSSTDSKAWKQTQPGPGDDLYGICRGRGEFVAVGKQSTILTSVDGEDWTRRASGTRQSVRAVAYGGDRFVAVGEQGVIVASADGKNWKRCGSATMQTLESVAYLSIEADWGRPHGLVVWLEPQGVVRAAPLPTLGDTDQADGRRATP